MNRAKVSIIVPCFMQGQFLGDCLESVERQTYTNWECLIVNDGSTDCTKDVSLEWVQKDKRFYYFEKQNGGLSSARNFGLSKVKGDYIQFLDADDLLERDKLNYQIGFLLRNNTFDIVYSSAKFFYNGDVNFTSYSKNFNGTDWTLDVLRQHESVELALMNWNIMVVSAPIMRKSIVDRVGDFDEDLKALEDWDFWIRCMNNGAKFKYLDKKENTLTLIRCHDGSMSTNNDLMDQYLKIIQIKHKDFFNITRKLSMVSKQIKLLVLLYKRSKFYMLDSFFIRRNEIS